MKRMMATAATVLILSVPAFGPAQAQGFTEYSFDAAQNLYASDLMNARVYATETAIGDMVEPGMRQEWDDLGEVNDMILTRDGNVEAVVLGVGGFLGVGERDIAVNLSDLQILRDGDATGDVLLVVTTTRAGVEGAPAFVRDPAMVNAEAADTQAAVDDRDVVVVQGDQAGAGAAAPGALNTAGAGLEEGASVAETDTAATSEATGTQVVPLTENTLEGDFNNTADASDVDTDIIKSETSQASELATNDVEAQLAEETETAETGAATTGDQAIVAGTTATTAERPMLQRPTIQREGFLEVAMDELTAEDLEGTTVYGLEDESVGELGELILSGDGGTIERAVINIGGFLGLGQKQVAVTFDELQILRGEGNDLRIYIDSTQDALEAQPDYEG